MQDFALLLKRHEENIPTDLREEPFLLEKPDPFQGEPVYFLGIRINPLQKEPSGRAPEGSF